MVWILLSCGVGALYGAYKLGKAKERENMRREWRKIEARRIAAKQEGERDYDKTQGK